MRESLCAIALLSITSIIDIIIYKPRMIRSVLLPNANSNDGTHVALVLGATAACGSRAKRPRRPETKSTKSLHNRRYRYNTAKSLSPLRTR